MTNEHVLFFSISSVLHSSGRTVSHTTAPSTGTGLANHINPIPLAIVICPAVGIKPQISPSLELVYKHWGRKLYFLSKLWRCKSGAVGKQAWVSLCRMKAGRAKRPRGQTKGLRGHGIKPLRPGFLQLFWSCDPPLLFSSRSHWVTFFLA